VEPLLLDSAFLIALVFEADQNYSKAQSTWSRVTAERRRFITTTFVFNETVTFLNARGEHQLAVALGNQLLASPTIELIDVSLALIEQGWEFFVRHDDKTYSLTDCISFQVMKQYSLSTALTFDRHFAQAGFTLIP
jgi:predicted nucleic acid-binding protein